MKSSVDLYPEEYYTYLAVRRRLLVWCGVFASVVAAVAIASGSLWNRVRAAETDLAALEIRVQGMELWGAELTPLIGELETARERQRVLAQLVNEPEWSGLLNDLAAAASGDVWLREFAVESRTERDEDGNDSPVRAVSIHGYARTIDDFIGFMRALDQSPRLQNVDQRYEGRSDEFEDEGIREFDVEAELIS